MVTVGTNVPTTYYFDKLPSHRPLTTLNLSKHLILVCDQICDWVSNLEWGRGGYNNLHISPDGLKPQVSQQFKKIIVAVFIGSASIECTF